MIEKTVLINDATSDCVALIVEITTDPRNLTNEITRAIQSRIFMIRRKFTASRTDVSIIIPGRCSPEAGTECPSGVIVIPN